MEFTSIPGTDLKPSRVGLGTAAIGSRNVAPAEAIRTIHTAIEKGINLIDTAPIYGCAEEIIGKALTRSSLRTKVIIATKAGIEWHKNLIVRNSTSGMLMRELDRSLKRLQTSYIDIYQVHWPDPLVPLQETAELMASFQRQGKVRAIGISNFSLAETEYFHRVTPLNTVQVPYNILEREINPGVMAYARRNKITTITYNAICRGLLSGRMRRDTRFDGDPIRTRDPKFQQPYYAEYIRAVERLDEFAREYYGKTVLDLAIRWSLDQADLRIVLWGVRCPQQLDPLDNIMGWKVSMAAFRAIDRIMADSIKSKVPPDCRIVPLCR